MSLLNEIFVVTIAFSMIAVVIAFVHSKKENKPNKKIKRIISDADHMISELQHKIRGRK